MLIRLLLAIALLVVAFLVIRQLRAARANAPAKGSRQAAAAASRRAGWLTWTATAVFGLVLVLTLTGRMSWLTSLVAGALALLARLAAFAPHMMTLHQLWRRRAAATGNATATAWLDPSGSDVDLDARVLQGSFANRRLSQLSMQELAALRREIGIDVASLRLLVLHIAGRAGRASGAAAGAATASTDGTFGRAEAAAILGVDVNAGRDEIVAAHRRLMQRLHPDRGGSHHLAAQVNRAKDALLGDN
jgi:hypothetical protein